MQTVHSANAPAAVGPYSQAVDAGTTVYCAGQIPLDPGTMEIVPGGIEAQTRQVFANIRGVLCAADLTLNDVAKTTVYVTDLSQFAQLNAVYAECFGDHKPARSTVEVAALPKGALVEIEAIAVRPG